MSPQALGRDVTVRFGSARSREPAVQGEERTDPRFLIIILLSFNTIWSPSWQLKLNTLSSLPLLTWNETVVCCVYYPACFFLLFLFSVFCFCFQLFSFPLLLSVRSEGQNWIKSSILLTSATSILSIQDFLSARAFFLSFFFSCRSRLHNNGKTKYVPELPP